MAENEVQETEQVDPTRGDGAPEGPPEEMGLIREFVLFLRENKKWWLVPIIVMVVLLGGLLMISSTPAAPFIYTLF